MLAFKEKLSCVSISFFALNSNGHCSFFTVFTDLLLLVRSWQVFPDKLVQTTGPCCKLLETKAITMRVLMKDNIPLVTASKTQQPHVNLLWTTQLMVTIDWSLGLHDLVLSTDFTAT